MDIFRSLTGGARFNKNDAAVFEKSKASTSSAIASSSTLPTEIDFFGASTSTTEALLDRATAKKNKKRARAELAASVALEAGIDYPALLRQHRIKFTGLEPPNPITSIPELASKLPEEVGELSRLISENWKSMGLKKPTGIQMASWGVMLEKRDLLACAPTGSGKTLAFVLPLLLHQSTSSPTTTTPSTKSTPRALILEPTRELAMQVWRETLKLGEGTGVKVTVLGEEERKLKVGEKSTQGKRKWKKKVKKAVVAEKDVVEDESEDDQEEDEKHVSDDEEEEKVVESEVKFVETDILITTPLRLIYAIKAGTVDLSQVEHLILDEADKLFELNFVEQTDEIIAACTHPNLRKAMLSATMPSGVEEMAKSVMSGGGVGLIRVIVGHKDAATETIDQTLQFVGEEDHKLSSLRTLIATGSFTPPVLIFVQSILRAKELANELLFDGINADCIHADRTVEERDNAVNGFAEGKIWCLISTDVMGRGVDFKGVKLVINYDFPQSGGSYIHRIGRTGRAGKVGKAITFFTKADAPYLKSIVNVMRASGCEVPAYMLALKAPSQDARKKLNLKPLNRVDVRQTNGAGHSGKLGKKEAGTSRKRIMGGGAIQEKRKRVKGAEKNVGMEE